MKYQIRTGNIILHRYESWNGLQRRLKDFAKHSALTNVDVVIFDWSNDIVDYVKTVVPITFHRGEGGYGWQSPVGKGIHHSNGLSCSAQSWSKNIHNL